jgi:hypothetical protein
LSRCPAGIEFAVTNIPRQNKTAKVIRIKILDLDFIG